MYSNYHGNHKMIRKMFIIHSFEVNLYKENLHQPNFFNKKSTFCTSEPILLNLGAHVSHTAPALQSLSRLSRSFDQDLTATELKEGEVDACYRIVPGLIVCAEFLLQLVERHIERENYCLLQCLCGSSPFTLLMHYCQIKIFVTKTNL